jgi:hypothetical protein
MTGIYSPPEKILYNTLFKNSGPITHESHFQNFCKFKHYDTKRTEGYETEMIQPHFHVLAGNI